MKLYMLSKSEHSREATMLVEAAGVKCEIIPVDDDVLLANIDRALGIELLPALVTENRVIEGLYAIRQYLGYGGRGR
jgi:hypothetical protein